MVRDPVCNSKSRTIPFRCSRGGYLTGIGGHPAAQIRAWTRLIGHGFRPVCNARRDE